MATNTTTLNCRVTPKAKKSELLGWADADEGSGRVLRVKLNAPPVDGKANRELVLFLAKQLGLAKSAVRIRSGEKSRLKRVEIDGVAESELLERIALLGF